MYFVTSTISNYDNVIRVSDISERLDELKEYKTSIENDIKDIEGQTNEGKDNDELTERLSELKNELENFLDEYGDELESLEELYENCDGFEEIIRESYFIEYCKGIVNEYNIPEFVEINWVATAENIASDYTVIDFDGVDYYAW